MNKRTFDMVHIVLAVTLLCSSRIGGFVGGMFNSGQISTNTPSMPHRHRARTRSHPPSDGRWHMKYHRSRA